MSLKLREIIELMCRTRNHYCFRQGLFSTHVTKLTCNAISCLCYMICTCMMQTKSIIGESDDELIVDESMFLSLCTLGFIIDIKKK